MIRRGMFPHLVRIPEAHRKALIRMERKSALLPQGIANVMEFFSPDGGRTMIDMDANDVPTALAFCAYWYVATRWRAQKIAEAPLMVVHENQDTGEDEWIPAHELSPLLDEPNADFDMGELLERTSHYLDNGGEALWTVDMDGLNAPARLMPWKAGEFTVERKGDRIFGLFKVGSAKKEFDASQVCYFRDGAAQGWSNVSRSRLSVALSWLSLGERSRKTITDLLSNAVWPSAVVIPDKDWNPDEEAYEKYKQDLQNYSLPGNQGKAFVQLGGGSFQRLAASIKDLVPTEVLDRAESVVAAVSGVPAIVLQFQVGLVNSPWSQMAQARRMAYDDTIQPSWRKFERVLTRQLLRPVDTDTTRFIRFDTSKVEALKADRNMQAQTMALIGKIASVNERRAMVDLEPVTKEQDPNGRADEIPELTAPTAADIIAGIAAQKPNDAGDGSDPAKDPKDKKPQQPAAKMWPDPFWTKLATRLRKPVDTFRPFYERKFQTASLHSALREEAHAQWKATSMALLKQDKDDIVEIINVYLVDAALKSIQSKTRGKDRVMTAVIGYLKSESQPRWAKATTPLLLKAAERSTAVIAADINVNYGLLHPSILKFVNEEGSTLITGISKTTREAINDAIAVGLEEGLSVKAIADKVGALGVFGDARADLIARTELTRAFNGAPNESVKEFARLSGRRFVKTWSGALDDVEREEHVALEGETVDVEETFSNGLDFPSEPNCRCTALISEVE